MASTVKTRAAQKESSSRIAPVMRNALLAQSIEATPSDLEALAPEWNTLCATSPNQEPFLYPYWFIAFAKSFNAGRPVQLITIRDKTRLRGVLPLKTVGRFLGRLPTRTLRSLSNIHSCRFDLICAPEDRDAVAAAAWRCLKERDDWNAIEAIHVPRGGAFESIMKHAQNDGYLTALWPTQRSPFLLLPPPGSPPLQNCPSRYKDTRKRLDKYFRKLKEHGEPSFKADICYSEELFKRFLELEGSGWKAQAGSAIKCDPTTTTFYREILRGAGERGHLRMCSLLVAGKLVAMEMAFVAANRCYSPKVAYDETFSHCAPGHLLARRVIEELVELGVDRYDTLGSQARHKAVWAGEERPHAHCYIFRPTLAGRARHTLVSRIAPQIKRLKYSIYGDPQSLDQKQKKGKNQR